jgi:hypothetical protein
MHARPTHTAASRNAMTATSAQSARNATPLNSVADARKGSRGQVIVIFAGALLLLMMMTALVVDVSWYWVNSLRVQRAADAAALAGAVMLPNKEPQAKQLAWEEASKNGYPNGGGIIVTPVKDPDNDRRLDVTIHAPIGTFFMRVIGIDTIGVTRTSKAEFTLPVPMGSPQNYYGVGFYEGRVSTTTPVPGNTDWQPPATAVAGGQWTNPTRAFTNNDSYATESTNNESQQWTSFNNLQGLIPNNGTLVIDGLEVRLTDTAVNGTGADTNCRLVVETSWNGGTNWSTNVQTPPLWVDPNHDQTVGSNATTADWGGHSWSRDDFTNANFRVRVTWRDNVSGCSVNQAVQMDLLEVRVQYHTTTTTWTTQTLNVPDPAGGTLASQGFWGAIFTSGGWRENGDRYAPSYIGNGTGAPSGSANPDYDPDGYDYLVEVGASGQIMLFDPVFCATGGNGHGGLFGAGDHWTSPTGNAGAANFTGGPVAVTYTLYDTKGTLANPNDDGPPYNGIVKTYDPGTKTRGDFSGAFGTPDNNLDPDREDCSAGSPAGAGHNVWVPFASALPAGFYRLNVNTSLDPSNIATGAENLFSIWVKANAGNARVYGSGRMAAYTNLDAGNQTFYFAQIEKVHAGKQLEIQLFDPGESSGNAFLRFLSPDGNNYHYATFDWFSDDGRHQEGVTSLQTAISGAAQFNNRLVTITIDLPNNYGVVGLNPPGDITTEDGWWRIEYNINAANDTTTWAVTIRGNPVHLVLP